MIVFRDKNLSQITIQNKTMDLELNINEAFPADINAKKCGCYVRNPHQYNIQHQSAMVPLKNIDYQLEIVNSLMNITLAQKYYNPLNKFLQVDYSFAISPKSSIYKFSAEFNNVKIEGIVKEREEAKKQFQQAKSQGKQAVIGTIDPLSKDIMNLEIGNIPPKTQFTINISFMQEMTMTLNTFYRIQIPSTISPRCASNAWDILEMQKKQTSILGKPEFTWSFKIQLRTTRKCSFFDSPSHDITLISQNQKGTQTILAMTNQSIPTKDFIFMYTTEDFHLPGYVLGKTDASSTVMLSFIPKFCTLNLNDAYKASVQNKSYQADINSAKGDYIFLLDRSGSMSGSRIKKAKQALILFLKSLPADSYFNVISFGSGSQKMFPNSQRYTAGTLDKAIKTIEPMGANFGGTQIYNPLNQILGEQVNKGYPKHVFLLTDGGVSNTQGVLNLIKKKTKYCRVHSIGVGNGASFNLIQGSAENGKGKFIMISDHENPSEKIIELLETTLTPLISDISLKYDEDLVESIVPNPRSIPYILKDDTVNFYVTFKKPFHKNTHFTFEYQDSVSKLPYKSQIQVECDAINEPFVDKMAHLKVIKNLEEAAEDGIEIEDRMLYVKVKDYKAQAIKQSVKHQVLSEYTAFLCVGKELVDGKLQEYANKGSEKVKVQQPKPIQHQPFGLMGEQGISRIIVSQKSQMIDEIHTQIRRSEKISRDISQKMQIQACSIKMDSATFQKKAKKSSGVGFFEGIGNAISGFFSTKKQEPKLETKRSLKKAATLSVQREVLMDEEDLYIPKKSLQAQSVKIQKNEIHEIPQMPQMQEIKEVKIQKLEKPKITSLTIENVIKVQNIDGSWDSVQLLKLSNKVDKVKKLMKEIKQEIVITYLVSIWIKKFHPQKQYSLLVKKAEAWLKVALKENKIEEERLSQLNKYI